MRYRITGLQRETGEKQIFEVEAESEREALNMASDRGYVVESAQPIPPALDTRGVPRAMAWLPYAISGLALALSCAAIGWVVFSHPLGRDLDAYDLETPEAALESFLNMQHEQDFRALFEIQQLRSNPNLEEKIHTLKVHKASDYQAKKILFISFDENGLTRYETECFEKDADTGIWIPTFMSTYDMGDAELADAIDAWENQSPRVEPIDE